MTAEAKVLDNIQYLFEQNVSWATWDTEFGDVIIGEVWPPSEEAPNGDFLMDSSDGVIVAGFDFPDALDVFVGEVKASLEEEEGSTDD